MNRPRRAVAACLGALALAALSACSSQPGNRRVVSDVIEAMQLPAAQELCMFDRLEGYSDDQLNDIADENENWDPSSGSTLEQASEGMRVFIADFEQCATESSVPSATSEPSDVTQPSEPATTSQSTESSEPAADTTLG